MIKAVIFDMDGLMFDTETMLIDVLQDIAQRRGLNVPISVIEQLIGCDSRKVNLFEKEYPGFISCMDEFQEKRMDYFFEYFKEPGSANKKGLKELVQYLDSIHMPYAIASSSQTKDIIRMVNHAGFDIHPQAIISSKDGIASKPSPDIFLVTAKQLHVKPISTLVLEDSKYGIMAAKRAHIKSIFIPDKIQPDEEMMTYLQETRSSLLDVIDYIKKEQN